MSLLTELSIFSMLVATNITAPGGAFRSYHCITARLNRSLLTLRFLGISSSGKTIRTMATAVLAAVAAFEQKMLSQNHQAVFEIVILAFDQSLLFWFIFRFVHTVREIPCCLLRLKSGILSSRY